MKKSEFYLCPDCKQDMRAAPHKGVRDIDCSRCGQGLHWKIRRAQDKKKKMSS